MVTNFATRSGFLMARLMPTTPPIELPIIAADSMPSPSMNASPSYPR